MQFKVGDKIIIAEKERVYTNGSLKLKVYTVENIQGPNSNNYSAVYLKERPGDFFWAHRFRLATSTEILLYS